MLAHDNAYDLLSSCKDLINDCSKILKIKNILKPEDISNIIEEKYPGLFIQYDITKKIK